MNEFRNNPWKATTTAPSDNEDMVSQAQEKRPGTASSQDSPTRRPPIASRPSRSRERRGSSSSRRKLRTLKVFTALLLLVLVAVVAATGFVYNRYRVHRADAMALTAENTQLREDLTEAQDNLTRLNNDLRILLSNRIPGVVGIQLNRQIEINDRYFRSLTLSRSGVGEEGSLEFHAVLHNRRPEPVLADARILLFDDMGLQTGSTTLTPDQSITPVSGPELQPDETRTYSGKLSIERPSKSRYFLVEVR